MTPAPRRRYPVPYFDITAAAAVISMFVCISVWPPACVCVSLPVCLLETTVCVPGLIMLTKTKKDLKDYFVRILIVM